LILFLDSSALVKRYVDEPESSAVDAGMTGATGWVASQVTFVETLRTLTASEEGARRARREWDEFEVIGLSQAVCERAVGLSARHRLRSLDAIQLASAMTATDDLTFATFDRRLHAAAQAEGLTTLPASLS
jgi:uncharacterized protein